MAIRYLEIDTELVDEWESTVEIELRPNGAIVFHDRASA